MTPERLLAEMEAITIFTNAHWMRDTSTPPSWWYVIDERTADPDFKYPGRVLGTYDTLEAAKLGRATAILARLTAEPTSGVNYAATSQAPAASHSAEHEPDPSSKFVHPYNGDWFPTGYVPKRHHD